MASQSQSSSKKKQKTSEALAGALSAFDPKKPEQKEAVPAASAPTESSKAEITVGEPPVIAPDSDEAPENQGRTSKIAFGVMDVVNRWRNKITSSDAGETETAVLKAEIAESFLTEKQGLRKNFTQTDKTVVAWLDELSTEETEALNRGLTSFFADLNVEFSWLKDPQVEALTKQAIQRGTALFALAYREVSRAQADVTAFATLKAWQKNPTKEHKALFEKLFIRLIEKQLAPPPPPELLLAPEKERQAHITDTINQAAQQNMQAVHAILKDLINPDDDNHP